MLSYVARERTMIGRRAFIDKLYKFFRSLLNDLRTRKRIIGAELWLSSNRRTDAKLAYCGRHVDITMYVLNAYRAGDLG